MRSVHGGEKPGQRVALTFARLASHLYRVASYPIWVGHDAHRPREAQAAGTRAEAVERPLEAEAGCEQVMHLLASTRAAMAGLMTEVVADHGPVAAKTL
jgi:hypothetical protein